MVEILARINWEGGRSVNVDLSSCCRIKGNVLLTGQRRREQELVEKQSVLKTLQKRNWVQNPKTWADDIISTRKSREAVICQASSSYFLLTPVCPDAVSLSSWFWSGGFLSLSPFPALPPTTALLWSVRKAQPCRCAGPGLTLGKMKKEKLREVGCSHCSPADPPLSALWSLSKALGSLKNGSV